MLKEIPMRLLQTLCLCVAIVLLSIIINAYVLQLVIINSDSMQPNFNKQDMLLINKMKNLQKIDRYDIVVVKTKDRYNPSIVKRVYGLPGETIRIKDSKIYINGKIIKDPYLKENKYKSGLATKEIKLKDDEYFVLGDNRNKSCDSRHKNLGIVNKKYIMGEAILCVYPFKTHFK